MNHPKVYSSTAKEQWREHIYSLLTPKNCHKLVDKDGNFKHKWFEPIGTGALPFEQLIATGRISESQLIGVDLDPSDEEGSRENIKNCRIKFPQAEFFDKDWKDVCSIYPRNDIGYIIFDLYNSSYGKPLKEMLRPTLRLIDGCRNEIGEVLIVINTVFSNSVRFNEGSAEKYAEEVEKILQFSSIESIRQTKIDPKTLYTYRGDTAEMGTYAIILR